MLIRARHALSTNFPVTLFRRRVADLSRMKGLHDTLPEHLRDFSPWHGAIYLRAKVMLNEYKQAQSKEKRSSLHELIKQLFFLQGEQFHTTKNKSYPASAMSPSLLGSIVKYLQDGTFTEHREALCQQWKSEYEKTFPGEKISCNKILNLISIINAAKQDCISGRYPVHFVEHMLVTYLHLKYNDRSDYISYIQALSDEPVTIKAVDKYSEDERQSAKMALLDNKITHNDQEYAVLGLMRTVEHLPQVYQSNYGYEDKPARPNCIEAGFNNLCNIMIFNESTGKFDFSLLPNTIKLHPSLQDYYKQLHFGTEEINSPKAGQQFMNLLANLDNIDYRKVNYEVKSEISNFLPLMNYLFGCHAKNLNELSRLFSDERRKVDFEMHNQNIVIAINAKHSHPIIMRFIFNVGHGELQSDYLASDMAGKKPMQTISYALDSHPNVASPLFLSALSFARIAPPRSAIENAQLAHYYPVFNFIDFISIARKLPITKTLAFVEHNQHLIKTAVELVDVVDILPIENRVSFVEKHLNLVTKAFNLRSILILLPNEDRARLIDKFQGTLTFANEVVGLLQIMPEELISGFIKRHEHLIKNYNDIISIFPYISSEEKMGFLERHHHLIKDDYSAKLLYDKLSDNDKSEFKKRVSSLLFFNPAEENKAEASIAASEKPKMKGPSNKSDL